MKMTHARLALGLSFFALLTFALAPLFVAKRSMAAQLDGGLPHLPADDCLPKDPPPPLIKLKVKVAACSAPGAPITYRICVENCSPSEAHHVTIKDALPSNAKFVKADPEPTKREPELQWNLGTIGAGGVREIMLTVQPTNKEDVKNCVRVVYEHGLCLVTRQAALFPPGMGPGPGDRPPFVTPVPEADLPVLDVQILGEKERQANLDTKYDIVVTNKGKTKATSVQARVQVSDKLKIVGTKPPAADTGVDRDNQVAWNLPDLEPGATRIVQVTLKAKEKGEHCFKASAVAAEQNVRKEVEFCTKFIGVSAMSVEMYDRDGTDPAFVGHKVSYPITIRSLGSEPITNIRVVVIVPNAVKFEKATLSDALKRDATPAIESRKAMLTYEQIEFKALPQLEGGGTAQYEVFVEALRNGHTRFRVDIYADQLERPVVEEESTTIVDDREPPR